MALAVDRLGIDLNFALMIDKRRFFLYFFFIHSFFLSFLTFFMIPGYVFDASRWTQWRLITFNRYYNITRNPLQRNQIR